MIYFFKKRLQLTLILAQFAFFLLAQNTTSSIDGVVRDSRGEKIIGAAIKVEHLPTGSIFRGRSNKKGHYCIHNLRAGGPYKIEIDYFGLEKTSFVVDEIPLGDCLTFCPVLGYENDEGEVKTKTEKANCSTKKSALGSSKNISTFTLEHSPTIMRTTTDFTRFVPQSKGFSFAGVDSRLNNFQIDGARFNNSFGLQEITGLQTNTSPISLDAIAQININATPFDVRQGGFAGANINAVTRAGSNHFEGSVFMNYKTHRLMGSSVGQVYKNAKTQEIPIEKADFQGKQIGFRFGGPLIKNKLFFFINGETEIFDENATRFLADKDNNLMNNDEKTSRVTVDDAEKIRNFLKKEFNYETGAYQNYKFATNSKKGLARLDWNINKKVKALFRINYLQSKREQPIANSGAIGARVGQNALTFQHSNYAINNDMLSFVTEINSSFAKKSNNKLSFSYTKNRDYRSSNSTPFPTVDILKNGQNYLTFGYEPFSPNNFLNSETFQLSDNFTLSLGKHLFTAGFDAQRYTFVNSFTPNFYGQYIFNSMDEFEKSVAKDPTSSAFLYSASYSLLPAKKPWSSTTIVSETSAYLQDEWKMGRDFRLTAGVRVDVPLFFETQPIVNPKAENFILFDEKQSEIHLTTGFLPDVKIKNYNVAAALPNSNPNIAPRLGFVWDLNKNRTQINGGAGYFSGQIPYIWLANNITNNGMTNDVVNFLNYKIPFSPKVGADNPNVPATTTSPAAFYDLAGVDSDFRFPQTLRGNLNFEQKLPQNFVLSIEAMYQKTLNDILYVNANATKALDSFSQGADQRAKFQGTGKLKYNTELGSAIILKNSKKSEAQYFTITLSRQNTRKWSGFIAYNYGKALDLMHGTAIASNAWQEALSVNGNNNITDLGFSRNDQRHRLLGSLTFKHQWKRKNTTYFTLFGESKNQGNYSYAIRGDANFDGLSGNDLMYIPAKNEQLKFVDILKKDGTVQFSAAEQAIAFDAFIQKDAYLSANRGKYAQRNGALLPFINKFDLSIIHDYKIKIAAKTTILQARIDILNVGNLLKNTWGVGYTLNNFDAFHSATAILSTPLDKNGKANIAKQSDEEMQVQMIPLNGTLDYEILTKSAYTSDVWQAQVGLRWSF
jgi:hypothetical protein